MISKIKKFLWEKGIRIILLICGVIILLIMINGHIYIVSDPVHLETTPLIFIIFPEFIILLVAELAALGFICYALLGYIPFVLKKKAS